MALQDFIKKLEEQDDADVIYSKSTQNNIRVIPPVNMDSKYSKSIIPEVHEEKIQIMVPTESKPKVLKFKISSFESIDDYLDLSEIKQTKIKPKSPASSQKKPNDQQIKPKQEVPQQKQEPVKKPVINNTPKQHVETEEERLERWFKMSDTSPHKKTKWFEYYYKAKESRKANPVVERVRVGRFMITDDDQVILLPDYDTHGKNANDILKDKWLK